MEAQTLEAILGAHPFFQEFQPQHIQLIAGCASNRRFDAGHYIFREGEIASHFYLIRSGKVALETFAERRGAVMIETIEAGEVLGWSWLFPPYRWHFDARVVVPARVIVIEGTCLRAKSETDHDLGYELLTGFASILIERLQAVRLQLLDVYRDHA